MTKKNSSDEEEVVLVDEYGRIVSIGESDKDAGKRKGVRPPPHTFY